MLFRTFWAPPQEVQTSNINVEISLGLLITRHVDIGVVSDECSRTCNSVELYNDCKSWKINFSSHSGVKWNRIESQVEEDKKDGVSLGHFSSLLQ